MVTAVRSPVDLWAEAPPSRPPLPSRGADMAEWAAALRGRAEAGPVNGATTDTIAGVMAAPAETVKAIPAISQAGIIGAEPHWRDNRSYFASAMPNRVAATYKAYQALNAEVDRLMAGTPQLDPLPVQAERGGTPAAAGAVEKVPTLAALIAGWNLPSRFKAAIEAFVRT